MRTDKEYKFNPDLPFQEIRLTFDDYCPGHAQTLNIKLDETYRENYFSKLESLEECKFSSLNATVPLVMKIRGHETVTIPKGTIVAVASTGETDTNTTNGCANINEAIPVNFKIISDPLADPLQWEKVPRADIEHSTVEGIPILEDRQLTAPELTERLKQSTTITSQEWDRLKPPEVVCVLGVVDDERISCAARGEGATK